MGALAVDSLGRRDRRRDRTGSPLHPGAETAPRDGLPRIPGILRLEKIYSRAGLEAASERAVQLQTYSYQSLKSILKRSLDRQLLLDREAAHPGPKHQNLRGPHYYDPPTNLVQ